MKPTKPRPWLAEGYTFSIPGWPPGHVPQPIGRSAVTASANAVKSRQTALDRGHTGTIEGMGKPVADAAKGRVSR